LSYTLRIFSMLYLFAWMVFGTFRTSGLDYNAYLNEFNDPESVVSTYEVGYVALINAIRPFGSFWIILLLANATFLVSNLKAIGRVLSWPQAMVFMFYLTYVGLFLICGSPRRLIAYALISYCIFVLVFQPEKFRQHPLRHIVITGIAASFHITALVFTPIILAYSLGAKLYKSGWRILFTLCVLAFVGSALYFIGTFDYITVKIGYYIYYASMEQEYLSEVPSVTVGLIKRFIAISLIWFGTRKTPEERRPMIDLCFIEILIYGVLGSISPVLAMASSYFSVAYLIPALRYRRPKEALSQRGLIFMIAGAIYFLPTSIGLIRILGHEYIN